MVITGAWLVLGILMELNNSINYDPVTRKHVVYHIFGNSLFEHLLITAIGPIAGGLLGGSFIVFYQREKLKGKTYAAKLLIHSIIYILFVSFCIAIVGLVGAWTSSDGSNFRQVFFNDVLSLRVLRLLLSWYFIVILTIFLLDVSEKYGAGILRKVLMGRYHTPVQEDRIFLFLDLRSSTAIAEEIGDERYFKMLRFFYQVANEAIIQFKGEIYQYVGDEIVVSWPLNEGLKQANCLECFFGIREMVKKQEEIFVNNYGALPEFKGAIHSGVVTAGEIGLTKKDIVYSGDVLNTTARMVALCNHYKESLLISEFLFNAFTGTAGFNFNYVDSPPLRGKTIRLKLFGVKKV